MKTVFQILAMLAFLMVLGTIGGMEHNNIGIGSGSILILVFMVAGAVFGKLGGMYVK